MVDDYLAQFMTKEEAERARENAKSLGLPPNWFLQKDFWKNVDKVKDRITITISK